MKSSPLLQCFQLLLFIFLFSSCATILNSPLQQIKVSTDKKIKSVVVEQSILSDTVVNGDKYCYYFFVKRSPKPLKMKLITEDSVRTLSFNARKSFFYWYNIYANYGIGMLVDKNSDKRFAYRSSYYFDTEAKLINQQMFYPAKKGAIDITLSLPAFSWFSIRYAKGNFIDEGIMNIEAGLNYHYKPHQYLSLGTGVGTSRFGEYLGKGYVENAGTAFFNLQNHYMLKEFDVGYGVHFSFNQWQVTTLGDTLNLDRKIINRKIGPCISVQYPFTSYLTVGFLYQPGLLNVQNISKSGYEHYLSFAFIWRLPIKQ